MKKVEISARTVSGAIGLVVCYSLSIWLFWESQITLSNFKVDPEYSRFARALIPLLGRDDSKLVGLIVAFLSVHASWAWRYSAGDLLEKLWNRSMGRQSANKSTLDAHEYIVKDVKELIESQAEDSVKPAKLPEKHDEQQQAK